MIRTEYGACRDAAIALLEFQYPEEGQTSGGRVSIKVFRELAKMMRVMHGTHSFEVMGLEAARELVRDLAESIEIEEE